MEIDLVTRKDFEMLKAEILQAIRACMQQQPTEKQWLRSKEVRKMLNISYNTLQNLKVNGRLPATKLGGIYYYRLDDVKALLDVGDKR